jgi:hypothetical protein
MNQVRKLDGVLGCLVLRFSINKVTLTWMKKTGMLFPTMSRVCQAQLATAHNDSKLSDKTYQSYPRQCRIGLQNRAHLGRYQQSHGYQQQSRIV